MIKFYWRDFFYFSQNLLIHSSTTDNLSRTVVKSGTAFAERKHTFSRSYYWIRNFKFCDRLVSNQIFGIHNLFETLVFWALLQYAVSYTRTLVDWRVVRCARINWKSTDYKCYRFKNITLLLSQISEDTNVNCYVPPLMFTCLFRRADKSSCVVLTTSRVRSLVLLVFWLWSAQVCRNSCKCCNPATSCK